MIHTQVLARRKFWHQICTTVYQNTEILNWKFDRVTWENSKIDSANIRRSAIRSCRIAIFCVTSKEALVKEMLANKIEPKPYKVSHFLNEKYRGVVLAKE